MGVDLRFALQLQFDRNAVDWITFMGYAGPTIEGRSTLQKGEIPAELVFCICDPIGGRSFSMVCPVGETTTRTRWH
jgi:hypothetical protein